MQRIIENLTRQHRELVRTATELFGWLDERKLAAGAASAFSAVASLSGILKVHLAMEDESLYPHLIQHPDPELRSLARRFLEERGQVRQRFDAYREAWSSPAAIERDPPQFVEETREILGLLWNRMKMEDDVLHPEIVRVCG